MSSLYTSLPLKREQREIRLISLEPGSFSDDIKCTLFVASLLHKPEYEALSYTWGDENGTSVVYVNGYEHRATQNLVVALRYLRYVVGEPRILWIDAISINQNSEEEKSWQVAMMSSIYASCETANVWLGTELDMGDFQHAGWFSFTRMYPGRIGIIMQMALSLVIELSRDKHLGEIYLLDYHKGDWDPIDNDPSLALQGMNVLLQRPWWERVWVVQEVVIPPTVIVTCGHLQLEWKQFEDAAKNFGKHAATCCRGVHDKIKGYNRAYFEEFFNAVTPISILRTKLEMEETVADRSVSFLELRHRFCNRQATLGKDKIFSLFSLLQETDPVIQHVPIDYSLSEGDLCLQVTTALVDTGSLDVLAGDRVTPSPSWPSWSKDFTATLSPTQKYAAVHRHAHQLLFPPYHISTSKPQVTANNLLALEGIHVDTIRFLAEEPYPERQQLDTLLLSPWLIALEDISEGSMTEYADISHIKVCERQNMKEAFWRTMLGEHVGSKGQGPTPGATIPETQQLDVTEALENLSVGGGDFKIEDSLGQSSFETVQRLERNDLRSLVDWLPTMLKSPKHENLNRFEEAMLTTVLGRRFAVGKGGYFGLVPKESQMDDEIWILQGARLPFILRKSGKNNDETRQLIGNCFIHGIIDAQVPTEVENALTQVVVS